MKPLVTPTPRQAEELRKLRFNADIMDYLDGCAKAAQDRLVACPADTDFRVAQGQAVTYRVLVELIRADAKASLKSVPGR